MNRIVKGITLTSIILSAGLVGVSCKKAPEPVKTTPVQQEAPEPKTLQEKLAEVLPNYMDQNDGNILYKIGHGDHVWQIVRNYVTNFYQVVYGRPATTQEVDAKVAETIKNNQDLAQKYKDFNGYNDFKGDFLMVPDHVEPGDTLKIITYELPLKSSGGLRVPG